MARNKIQASAKFVVTVTKIDSTLDHMYMGFDPLTACDYYTKSFHDMLNGNDTTSVEGSINGYVVSPFDLIVESLFLSEGA